MSEIIEVNNQFYILASVASNDERAFVLKHGDTFGVFDHYGNVHPYGLGEQGLFHNGTRHLSVFDLKIEDHRPLFLNSAVQAGNELFVMDLANPDFRSGPTLVPRGTVHLRRERFLWQATLYETLRFENYGLEPVSFALSIRADADYADIFEVRGAERPRRGTLAPLHSAGHTLQFSYTGLDRVVRTTRVTLDGPPTSASADGRLLANIALPPHGTMTCRVLVVCEPGASDTVPSHADAARAAALAWRRLDRSAETTSAAPAVAATLAAARDDVRLMLTETSKGLYPYAGVPWFSTPFGRDGIITAMEMLWVNPDIARGVLHFLARTQATSYDDRSDASPGKIIHELRRGEMAALGEIPFGRYYGTVDATPLFVWLAGLYYAATGDRDLVESIWPNLEAALSWMDTDGDADGDGFVDYMRRDAHGLVHQGWKDSHDAVSHADGTLAEPPIALCEVQGYVYAARRSAANLARLLGDADRADGLERAAAALADRFDHAFWLPEAGTYAMALDRHKAPCAVRSSNAGQCLATGIVRPDRSPVLAATLMRDSSFTGWGIRTLDSGEARYNPMSYHNGSVWPHDTALVAAGLASYGHKAEALRLTKGLFDLGASVHLHRLPELICGMPRIEERGPTLYPVACAPQSWSAASVFMALQSCLGMSVDGPRQILRFDKPALPSTIPDLSIRNLRIGNASADLTFVRHPENVGVTVNRRAGQLDVVVTK